MTWSPPERIGDYRILRPLGRGASGSVYLARDETLERMVAVKVIDAPGEAQRTLAEARAVARIRHPNVVVVHAVGEVEGRAYIVSEYVPGTPLSQLPRPMPWPDVLPIAVGVARGLAAVHAVGLLHRDIKPGNVVLDEYQTPKLVDFGLAVEHRDEAPEAAVTAAPVDVTLVGGAGGLEVVRVAGTPRYLAPEVWRGEGHSHSTDIFAVGRLMYELMVGRFEADAAPLGEVMPSVPRPVAAVVEACLDEDASKRPPHGGALAAELEAARESCVLLRLVEPLPVGSPRLEMIRSSLHRLVARPDALASAFYAELFGRAPEVRRLFPDQLEGQIRKLADALRLAVGLLDRPSRLTALLEELGARHLAYGVEASHFEALRPVLLPVLERLDADAWTPALEDAWSQAWDHLLDTMRAGMERHRAAYVPGA